jgi:16S rRNA processing protein RimM
MTAPSSFGDLITIGRIVKPQGRRGEVLAEPLSDVPGRFPALKKAFVPGPGGEAREVSVTSCWPHKGRFVLKLAGVDSIDAAERLRGLEIRTYEEPLPEGSYYHHQLRGLRVEDEKGRPLGVVAEVMETGADSPVLVVRGPEDEVLIPFAAAFVKKVDVEGGRLLALRPESVGVDAED